MDHGNFIGKESCINLDSYYNNGKTSRIEIRGFGNKDYEKKYPLIENYIGKIGYLMHYSHPEMKIPNLV
jgi:hypothetical protein